MFDCCICVYYVLYLSFVGCTASGEILHPEERLDNKRHETSYVCFFERVVCLMAPGLRKEIQCHVKPTGSIIWEFGGVGVRGSITYRLTNPSRRSGLVLWYIYPPPPLQHKNPTPPNLQHPNNTACGKTIQITRSNIRPRVKWAVSLVIADGHLIFLGGCVGMYGLAYFVWFKPILFSFT